MPGIGGLPTGAAGSQNPAVSQAAAAAAAVAAATSQANYLSGSAGANGHANAGMTGQNAAAAAAAAAAALNNPSAAAAAAALLPGNQVGDHAVSLSPGYQHLHMKGFSVYLQKCLQFY